MPPVAAIALSSSAFSWSTSRKILPHTVRETNSSRRCIVIRSTLQGIGGVVARSFFEACSYELRRRRRCETEIGLVDRGSLTPLVTEGVYPQCSLFEPPAGGAFCCWESMASNFPWRSDAAVRLPKLRDMVGLGVDGGWSVFRPSSYIRELESEWSVLEDGA